MLEFFEGSPVKIVCDNLKTGVITHPKHGGIVLNDAYLPFAEHYQAAIMPAEVRRPKQKPSVEGSVGRIARKIIGMLRNGTFYSVDALNHGIRNLLYDDIPDTLSQLIRTAFIARPGYKFVVSDYSAIEARVLAHLAGESWRSKVFAEEKDIYCASASQMFGVPVEKHGVNSHLRQKGKIAELALGYGGPVNALKSMRALDMRLTEEELQPLVNSWREANPMITAFW